MSLIFPLYSMVIFFVNSDLAAASMAKWFRTLIFSALNLSSSHGSGFDPSLGHMRDKPSSACGWSGVFSRGSPIFAPL